MSEIECPICKSEHHVKSRDLPSDSFAFECGRCGDFIVTGTEYSSLSLNSVPDPLLSAWVREHKESNESAPIINSKNLPMIREQFRNYTPTEKQSILLRAIERKSKYPGDWVLILRNLDYPLCWATSEPELDYYLNAIKDRGHINWSSDDHKALITAKGWEYLENYSRTLEDKKQAFVAMSFSPQMESVWSNALKPGIEDAGYHPYRVDKILHNERIDIKIMEEIKKSRFVVADFTENKHGVYFEAGYALGLGIPVIWAVRKNQMERVHFDTNHYQHIVWDTEQELRQQVAAFINVLIGNKKPKTL